MLCWILQRQADRIKREKAQSKRGDDAQPQFEPESLVPVSRFHGSRLASAPAPSPFQRGQNGSSNSSVKTNGVSASSLRAQKVARLSSGATIGAAIVEAENSLEMDVSPLALNTSYIILTFSSVPAEFP